MKTRIVMIFITCPSTRGAEILIRSLLTKKLIACGTIVPGARSLFWWHGKIDSAKEAMIIAKTTSALFTTIDKTVRKVHPYEVPEIIALPVVHISKAYAGWLKKTLAG